MYSLNFISLRKTTLRSIRIWVSRSGFIYFLSLFLFVLTIASSGCTSLFEMQPHKKWSFVDKSGRTVIAAQFDDVARDQFGGVTLSHKVFRNFSSGLCAVRVGNKWGYIDKAGHFIVPAKYDSAGAYSEGLAFVRLGTKYGYIDRTGKVIVPIEFDVPPALTSASNANPDWDFSQSLIEKFEFSEGLAVAFRGTKAGFIDKNGLVVIKPTFIQAQPFFDGLAAVQIAGDQGSAMGHTYIDKVGRIVAASSQHCIDYSSNVFVATNGKFGIDRRLFFIDLEGQRLSRDEFVDARIISEGLAAVSPQLNALSEGKGYGYADSTGKIVIAPHFEVSGNNFAANFRHGRAVVTTMQTDALGNNRNLHGVVDKAGHWVLSPKYDHISAYCDGLARAMEDGKCLYLDMDGKTVFRINGFGNSFSEGLAAVMEQ
jgi:hypothetical protein